MIIKCINCFKKFNVNANLIPEHGRLIQCGSCNHEWFFKTEKLNLKDLVLNEKNIHQKIKSHEDEIHDLKIKQVEKSQSISDLIVDTNNNREKKNKETNLKIQTSTSNSFFSYLIVFFISLIALIVLIDTIEAPLIKIFPGIENMLFNLFETLKDIKLFIIDLT